MDCCTTINNFTALHLLCIWDLIAPYNIPMPTKGSYLKLITSGSSIRKVKGMTSITPSKDEFLSFLDYTSDGCYRIRSSNFSSACRPGTQYWHFLRVAKRLNNGYYILKFKNTQWWFQQSSKIVIVGLIVLTGSSGLSNRQIWCIIYPFKRLLDQHIWCGRMLQWAVSIADGFQIIRSI